MGITEGSNPKPFGVKSEPFLGIPWKASGRWRQRWELRDCLAPAVLSSAGALSSRGNRFPSTTILFHLISFLLYSFRGAWKHLACLCASSSKDNMSKEHNESLAGTNCEFSYLHDGKMVWDQALGLQGDKTGFLMLVCLTLLAVSSCNTEGESIFACVWSCFILLPCHSFLSSRLPFTAVFPVF